MNNKKMKDNTHTQRHKIDPVKRAEECCKLSDKAYATKKRKRSNRLSILNFLNDFRNCIRNVISRPIR